MSIYNSLIRRDEQINKNWISGDSKFLKVYITSNYFKLQFATSLYNISYNYIYNIILVFPLVFT